MNQISDQKIVLFELFKRMIENDYKRFDENGRLICSLHFEKDALKDQLEKVGNESDKEVIEDLEQQIKMLLSFKKHYIKMHTAFYDSKKVLQEKWNLKFGDF